MGLDKVVPMKKYNYNYEPLNTPMAREDVEWSNTWYSKANSPVSVGSGGGKFLLIGDSTGRKVRSTFERMSKKPVDFFGTSAGIHDLLFCSQIESFFTPVTWKYEAIYVWLGYHSLRNEKGDLYGDTEFEQFRNDVRYLVDYLKQYSSRVILCSALYPVKKKEKTSKIDVIWFHLKPLSRLFKETILEDEASVIKKKNQIIKEVADEERLVFCDVNRYMLALCEKYRTRCIHFDKIHYEGKSFPLMAQYFLRCIDV